MLVSWDEQKDDEHIEKRGVGFSYVCQLLNKKHAALVHPDHPHQLRTVGKIEGEYWTLVIEYCEDDLGEFVWCSNFWKATKEEKEYARHKGIL